MTTRVGPSALRILWSRAIIALLVAWQLVMLLRLLVSMRAIFGVAAPMGYPLATMGRTLDEDVGMVTLAIIWLTGSLLLATLLALTSGRR